MKDLPKKLRKLFSTLLPFISITIVVLIFFWKTIFFGQIPIPGDFTVGVYYPWLDYKWGNLVGVPVKNPITSDVVSVIYPLRSLAVDLLKSGHLPLWNRSMFGGYPLLANMQVAVFSPTFILYLFLPKVWAWTGQIALQPFLAAFFTYLFFRHLKLSKVASILGGVTYAFSGFNTIWMEWNAHALVAAWIPLILLVLDKIIVERKLIFALILSILIACQFFSGYPQLMMYTGILCLTLIIFKIKRLNMTVIRMLVLSSILGLLLTSIQFLPALELLINSQRGSEFLAKDLVYLPWQNLIVFIAPDFFGNHSTGNFWGIGNYTNNVGYSGVITLILAIIAGVYLFKKTEVKYFLCVLFISLLLALENPISTLIWKTGFLGSGASSNTRSLVLANFSLASLAAFAIDLVLKIKRKISLLPGIFILTIILLIFLFAFVAKNQSVSFAVRNNYLIGMRNLIQPLVLVFLVTLILIVRNRFVKSARVGLLVVLALVVLSVFELFRFGWKYTPFSKTEYVFPETPVITYLKNLPKPNRILPGNVIPMNLWVPYGLESISGYDAAYPKTVAEYIAVSNSNNKDALPQGRYGTLELFTSRLTDIAGGGYLLLNNKNIKSEYQKLISSGKMIKVFSDRSVDVYKVITAIPRASLMTQWSVSMGSDILGKLLDPKFNPAEEVILEKPPQVVSSRESNISLVKYLSYLPDKSIVQVTTQNPGILFVSDTWYPGWHAYVDGNKTEILRADYAFQAITIPEGIHKVVFIYEPESFTIGKWISLSSAILLIGLLIYGQISKKSN